MNKIIIYNLFYFLSAHISLDMFEAFSFADIDIIYQKISRFFMSFIQAAAGIIKTSATFNSNSESNVGSFTYVAKQKCQASLGSKSDNNDSKAISTEGLVSEYETKDSHIEADVNLSDSSKNKAAIITILLFMLSYLCGQ